MKAIYALLILLIPFVLYSQNSSSEYQHLDNRIKSIQVNYIQTIDELYSKIVQANYTHEEKVYVIAKYIVENIRYGKRAKNSNFDGIFGNMTLKYIGNGDI